MRYRDLYHLSLRRIQDQDKTIDVQVIIEKAFQFSKSQFWIFQDRPVVDRTRLRRFYRYLNRLIRNEPLAYILKEREFFSQPFFVNKNVLIPRPETEILVDRALEMTRQPSRILDIGAGCGNISIILARQTGSRVWAVENSARAVYVLKKNIRRHGLEGRVVPLRTDLFPVKEFLFDLIVSNPPYLSHREWRDLPPHIRNYEPREALAAGKTGLEVLERIIRLSREYLQPGGSILLEIGYLQQPEVTRLLREAGFRHITFIDDYSGIPRVACGQNRA